MIEPKDILKKALGIIKLDQGVIKEVAEDKEAFLPALGIVAIGGLLAGIGSIFTGFFAGIIIVPIISIIGSFIGTGIIFAIAYRLGGRGSYLSLYKALGYASILGWLNIIPFIGWIPSLWMLVVMVIALQVILGVSRGRAITVGVVLVCLWLLIISISALTIFVSKMALKGAEKYTSEILEKTKKHLPEVSTEEEGEEEEVGARIAEKILKKSGVETKIGKLPKDLPEDIPIYKGAKVTTSMMMGNIRTLQLITSTSLEEVTEYYKEELKKKGWNIGFTMEQAEEGFTIFTGTKDERQIQVQIGSDEEGTSIVITY
ncbi:MAG: Yip1 family protein [bacterium]